MHFLKTSSVANLMNSSTVIMPSPLGSYFLNKVSKESWNNGIKFN